ncbi:MAG: aminotransferase class IV [Bacteroidales bacterium]|nr:aminotransferase class IV [Bacteroidales bacterium]MCF8402338.1 aminotransferase class IV [Bacteroidales bacterium]
MCQLFESIKVKNRSFQNIEYHNARFNYSRMAWFGINDIISLEKVITIPDIIDHETYKCRITYSEKIEKVEFEKYSARSVRSLLMVGCNRIEYNYKFADRSKIDELVVQKGDCDDILIIKKNLVTDTSYANIVFWDEEKWVTPASPLLKGTARERLIKEKRIFEKEILLGDLIKFEKARIINAMIDLDESEDILDFMG